MPDNISIYSIADLIYAYESYDTNDSNKIVILGFLSELTGRSEDSLLELIDQCRKDK